MEILRFESVDEAAEVAAGFVSSCAREAIAERQRFIMALSGGSTPWRMLAVLAGHELPWETVHIAQVDERLAPDGDSDRNLTYIQARFIDKAGIPAERLYAMPVHAASLEAGAQQYNQTLISLSGRPPVLDLVHLGLGSDGHTASLLPGDALLDEAEQDVGITSPYRGQPRMTLTYPVINRARKILWLITGVGKAAMLDRLVKGDTRIPAGRVSQAQATIITDIPE